MTEAVIKEVRRDDISFTQNRELSWLKFNERVLEESKDLTVPLFERLKFVSIFTSNLDEFFMIRVGSLHDLSLLPEKHIDNKSGMTPQEQLKAVFSAVAPLYQKKDQAFLEAEQQLRQYDVTRLHFRELGLQDRKLIHNRFKSDILPMLSPQVIDFHHPFPHLENKSLYVVMLLKNKGELRFGIIPIPKFIPRVQFLPGGGIRYMLTEDIVSEYAHDVFERYSIAEKSVVSVTRNADINPDDEAYDFEEDFRLHMKKILKKRARLAAVRLEVQSCEAEGAVNYLADKLSIEQRQVYLSRSPLDLSYVSLIEEKLPADLRRLLTYSPFEPQTPADVDPAESILRQVMRNDLLLCYPYHGMDTFLRLIKEASADPAVISVKITLYRIDKKSRLAEYLIAAAENGKDVTIIMELRARFDEQNNIEWAERLEEAGCKVIYGFEGFKVHAKLCLITRHEKHRFQYITQVGTGNFNEKTARLYADYALLTADEEIGSDANAFFKNMLISSSGGGYGRLLVAPEDLKRPLLALIDGEIDKYRGGKPAGILLKLNSLTDRDILDKLSEASCAGVPVQLIVRGICCLRPGIPGKTENVRVLSIIGRYLEHTRVYCFGAGNEVRMYISSADLMTRNTERRIEIAGPILDGELRSRILNMLTVQLSDRRKAWEMEPDGNYHKLTPQGERAVNSQEYMMEWASSGRQKARRPFSYGSRKKISGLLRRLFHYTLPPD